MLASSLRRLALLVAVTFVAAAPAAALVPQATELGRQTLGRPYWHVFIAYAIAVLLIGGWVFSIARRLLSIERRLERDQGE
jgi:CcmD family protein